MKSARTNGRTGSPGWEKGGTLTALTSLLLLVAMPTVRGARAQSSGGGDYSILGARVGQASAATRAAILNEIGIQYGTAAEADFAAKTDPATGSIGLGTYGHATTMAGVHDRNIIAVNEDLEPWEAAIAAMHEYSHIQNLLAYSWPRTPDSTNQDPTTNPKYPDGTDNDCAACNHLAMQVDSLIDIIERACDDPHPNQSKWCQFYKGARERAEALFNACQESDCSTGKSDGTFDEYVTNRRSQQGSTCPGFSCS